MESAVQEPIHIVLPQLGLSFGPKSEKIWEAQNHLLPIITWNNRQDTKISDSADLCGL